MFEVSTVLFSLIVEGFIALLVVVIVLTILFFKHKRRDRDAITKLVDQIKQQSKIRLEKTGSFLIEKYRFEGNDLEKAVKAIDKAEKKFMQRIINVYLKRDSDSFVSIDAWVAELIETYKELSPVMPDAEMLAEMVAEQSSAGGEDLTEELEALQKTNEKLAEELSITKETMGNMIAEFGNMFGGGKEHELEDGQVITKVVETIDEKPDSENTEMPTTANEVAEPSLEASADAAIQLDQPEDAGGEAEDTSIEDLLMSVDIEPESDELMAETTATEPETENRDDSSKKDTPVQKEVFDEGIDDLIDGIDLSDDT